MNLDDELSKCKSLIKEGEFDKALKMLKVGLELSKNYANIEYEIRFRNQLGKFYAKQAAYREAFEYFDTALKSARLHNLSSLASESLAGLGTISWHQGELNYAKKYLEEAIQIAQDLKEEETLVMALNELAIVYDRLGDYAKALSYHSEALKLAKELKSWDRIVASLINMAIVHANRGYYEQALQNFTETLEICQKIDNKQGIGNSLNNIGKIYAHLGKLNEAIDYFQKSLEIRREINDKRAIGGSLNNLLAMYLQKGDFEKAILYSKECIDLRMEIGDKLDLPGTLEHTGAIYYALNQPEEALDYYMQGINLRKELDIKDIGYVHATTEVSSIFAELGDIEKAKTLLRAGEVVSNKIKSKLAQMYVFFYKAYFTQVQGDISEAINLYNQTLEESKALGDFHYQVRSLIQLAELYLLQYYKNPSYEAKHQVKEIVDHLSQILGKEPFALLTVNLNILEALVDSLSFEYDSAIKKINQAIQIAKDFSLVSTEIKAKEELNRFQVLKKTHTEILDKTLARTREKALLGELEANFESSILSYLNTLRRVLSASRASRSQK